MIAIVPIRSGSNRVINKNIISINGKPLYYYIINTLLNVDIIDKIVISTDYDEEILQIFNDTSKLYYLNRPKHLRDNVNINLVIENVLKNVEGELFLQTHATNPLITENTIQKSIETFHLMAKEGYDSVFSCSKIQKRLWSIDAKPLNHSLGDEPTTQNLTPFYEENSCLYCFSRSSFEENINRIGTNPYIYITPPLESFDVDVYSDIELLKRMLS